MTDRRHEELAREAWEAWRENSPDDSPGDELCWDELSTQSKHAVICAVKAVLRALVGDL